MKAADRIGRQMPYRTVFDRKQISAVWCCTVQIAVIHAIRCVISELHEGGQDDD